MAKQNSGTENGLPSAAGLAPIEPGDPAPDRTVLPTERAQQIVRNISATALDEMAKLRDELDDLMRAVSAREEQVALVVTDFAAFAQEAIRCKLVIAENIVGLRKNFENSAPPLRVGKTVTQ